MEKSQVIEFCQKNNISFREPIEDLLSIYYGNIHLDIPCTQKLEQGYGFKSEMAYNNGDMICYVPEYGMNEIDGLFENNILNLESFLEELSLTIDRNSYTHDKFIDACGGWKSLADEVFDTVDWQFPETLLNDWESMRSPSELIYCYLSHPNDFTYRNYFKNVDSEYRQSLAQEDSRDYGLKNEEDQKNFNTIIEFLRG